MGTHHTYPTYRATMTCIYTLSTLSSHIYDLISHFMLLYYTLLYTIMSTNHFEIEYYPYIINSNIRLS